MGRLNISLAILLCALGIAAPVFAATITVTTTADDLTPNGNCSLREAIRAANLRIAVDACAAGTGADEIIVPAGIYTLTMAATNDNTALDGDLDVTGALTITGAGAGTTIIEACAIVSPATTCTGIDRVFDIRPGADVTIRGVTIRHGTAFQNGAGGGILNQAFLTLEDSVVSDNVSGLAGGGLRILGEGARARVTRTIITRNRAPSGGGISNLATLGLVNSLVSDNVGTGGFGLGGGIHNNAAATVIDSTIAGNVATSGAGVMNQISAHMFLIGTTVHDNGGGEVGGGIQNDGSLTLINSTVSGNHAAESGGGILNIGAAASAALYSTTVTANSVGGQGGGLRVAGGTVIVKNTILAGNVDSDAARVGTSPDCSGAVTSHGHNLVGVEGTLATGAAACTGIANGVNGDQVGAAGAPVDPGLTGLADHGGPTLTHALTDGSPAIDAGTPAGCTDGFGTALTTDQRGFARPAGAACDIGAFEGQAVASTSPDHFLCYRARNTARIPPFPGRRGLRLVDVFESGLFDVREPSRFCTPADKNGEGVSQAEIQLQGYELDLATTRPSQPHHVQQRGLRVENQFGLLTVDTISAERLLVPTASSLTEPVASPPAGAHGIDHYKCYRVRISPDTPRFERRTVTVADPFTPGKTMELQNVVEVCVAVDKQDEGVENPGAALACYAANPAAVHAPLRGMHVSNQLGSERLDVLDESTLCVPSTVAR